jgi:hypothetical protein
MEGIVAGCRNRTTHGLELEWVRSEISNVHLPYVVRNFDLFSVVDFKESLQL